jgi:hypothetical protein
MLIPKQLLSNGLKVWTHHRAWFWFLPNPRGDGGTIGSAATMAEAIHEALFSLESALYAKNKYALEGEIEVIEHEGKKTIRDQRMQPSTKRRPTGEERRTL